LGLSHVAVVLVVAVIAADVVDGFDLLFMVFQTVFFIGLRNSVGFGTRRGKEKLSLSAGVSDLSVHNTTTKGSKKLMMVNYS
jgi:hypothetical protein